MWTLWGSFRTVKPSSSDDLAPGTILTLPRRSPLFVLTRWVQDCSRIALEVALRVELRALQDFEVDDYRVPGCRFFAEQEDMVLTCCCRFTSFACYGLCKVCCMRYATQQSCTSHPWHELRLVALLNWFRV